jgi:oxalate decarboxylase family bicupin protein
VNTQNNPRSAVDPGPQNPSISGQFPKAFTPPATDVGDMPQFWASFNNAPRRIQDGGWARQVTQASFYISEEISGVNMRLTAGGIRELHWHQAAEWAFMSYGNCRITVLDPSGRAYVADVKEGDLWYFPAGYPHSLQGLGPDGCEFILAFDDGKQSEFNTLLVTDWMAHTPPDVLAENFGVPAETFSIPGRTSRTLSSRTRTQTVTARPRCYPSLGEQLCFRVGRDQVENRPVLCGNARKATRPGRFRHAASRTLSLPECQRGYVVPCSR